MRNIVVTGCSRGLGEALARFFASKGDRVIGCSRSACRMTELGSELGDGHDFSPVDVSDDEWVRSWATRIVNQYGAPDLLINNAAVIAPNAPLWEVSRADFDRVIDVNIKGVANVLRYFLPPMIERGKGIVANFSSGWGRSTSPEVAAYCASKWAIEGLTQSLAQELPEGMAAVAVNPGIIDTEMLQSCFGAGASHYPDAREWIRAAGPFFAGLTAAQNGRSLTVPGALED
ncbi:oxidoreductase [Spartobacteria bacterium LR76]|nr:oxidoreductase [Spartobacteria bacterium LR76]